MSEEPLSVVIPTIGRPRQLRDCLISLGACTKPPSEVIIVDQSDSEETEAVVAAGFGELRVRRLRSDERGVSRAVNAGLRAARCEFVAVTHDDCTVAPDWTGVATRLMRGDPSCLFTGSVSPPPGRDGALVPSTIVDPIARDYTGELRSGVLYPSNMVFDRSLVLSHGAFDPRFERAAEDNDFCYRWLRAGERLRYEPALRVTHNDWRTGSELRRLYRTYGRSQGMFYAKHLRAGDIVVLRFLIGDVAGSLRALGSAAVRRRPELMADPRGFLAGLPAGLIQGWRIFAPS